MDVNVKVLGTGEPSLGNFSIHLDNANETVHDVKKKIADHLKCKNPDSIKLLFSGQFLSDDQQRVGDLELGPSTFLNALIADVSTDTNGGATDQNSNEDHDQTSTQPRHWRSRFFVYCKNHCKELTPGKLRVRCSMCKSSAVLVKKEPNSWNDILTRSVIRCECLEQGCRSSSEDPDLSFPAVEFYFKCARCSNEDGVVPLPQVKAMRKDGSAEPCSICGEGEEGTRMIIFSCDAAHATCFDCFVAYATEKLERRSFVMHPAYGYTLPCPEPRCRDGYIADGHHFRLLGDELYNKYHRLAAEIYLLGEGGLYCPKVDCGEAFIADAAVARLSQRENETSEDQSNQDRRLILCPKCGWAFCFYCRASASECQCATLGTQRDRLPMAANRIPPFPSASNSTSDEVKSFVTIRWTTKACPNCRAPTEKNEGCNHMTCGQCSFDWCWDCEKRWTEDCQWNHWFD